MKSAKWLGRTLRNPLGPIAGFQSFSSRTVAGVDEEYYQE